MARQLSDALQAAVDHALNTMCVSMPAEIVSYDASTGYAVCQPVMADLPAIHDVPVVWPRVSGGCISGPLDKGEGVLLVFSDFPLFKWLVSAGKMDVDGTMGHSIADAIAIPGLVPTRLARPKANPSQSLLVEYEGSKIELSSSGVKVIGNLSVTGSISSTGDISTPTVSLNTHTHGGGALPSGNTGPPISAP